MADKIAGMVVYFDTNVYGHIAGHVGITDAQIDALRARLAGSAFSVRTSIANVEEVLLLLSSNRTLAIAQLRLINELAGLDRLIRPLDEIATEEIGAYATYAPPPSLEVDTPHDLRIVLRDVINNSRAHDQLLAELIEGVKRQKQDFQSGMAEARQLALAALREWGGKSPGFGAYWAEAAPDFVLSLANQLGFGSSCRERGLDGLLARRSIRLFVRYNLSLTYAHTFEGRKPGSGDSRDMQHAAMAAAADTFVTHDASFRHLLRRIPVTGLTISKLEDLL